MLETHIFHSFLRDRLNRKMDNFARAELRCRSEMQRWDIEAIDKFCPLFLPSTCFCPVSSRIKTMVEVSSRPTVQEIQAQRRSSVGESRPGKTRGMSLPNLVPHQAFRLRSHSLMAGILMPEPGETGEDLYVKPWSSPPHSDVLSISLCL